MTQGDPAATIHSLTELPEGCKLRAVTAVPAEVAGRRALRVDMPTFVIIPASFTNGTIEVNILSRLKRQGTRRLPGLRWHRLPRHRRWQTL